MARTERLWLLSLVVLIAQLAPMAQQTPRFTIVGRVVDPLQLRPEAAALMLEYEKDGGYRSDLVHVAADGSFVTVPVAAGTYMLKVVRTPDSATKPAAEVALEFVNVSTQDVKGVIVTIRRDTTIHGRYRMESDNPRAAWPPHLASDAYLALGGLPLGPSADSEGAQGGRFILRNAFGPRVVRTGYSLGAELWWPSRILLDGVDVTNVPTDFSTKEKSQLEVVFTQHPARFAGSVLGPNGQPLRNAWVVIVSADRALWQAWATTTHVHRVDAKNSFSFPTRPGRYLARGFAPDAFPTKEAALRQLDRLMAGVTPVELRDRETKMLKLVVQ